MWSTHISPHPSRTHLNNKLYIFILEFLETPPGWLKRISAGLQFHRIFTYIYCYLEKHISATCLRINDHWFSTENTHSIY